MTDALIRGSFGTQGGTAGQGKGVRQAKERVKYYFSPRAVTDNLLRKTINKNTCAYAPPFFASPEPTGP